MSLRIDLNADLGEGAGHDEELLSIVSSASVSCGAHAGDSAGIRAILAAARERGVAIGAHPSFPDRANFGRVEMRLPAEELATSLRGQLSSFLAAATAAGVRVRHVKPHGALYNLAARDSATAQIICQALDVLPGRTPLFAPMHGLLANIAVAHGLPVVREFFADRHYLPDGFLAPRSHPRALVHDVEFAVRRVLHALREGTVDSLEQTPIAAKFETVCVHGDTPGALEFAQKLGRDLREAGIAIMAPGDS